MPSSKRSVSLAKLRIEPSAFAESIALLAAGQVKSALQVIDDAAKNLTGGIALSYCFLQKGIALNRLGEFAEAAKVLDQAIEKTGQETGSRGHSHPLLFQDSISLARQEQYEQALRALTLPWKNFAGCIPRLAACLRVHLARQ